MERLSSYLGGPRLWVKREDLTGIGVGGNKLRKLDYVLHEATTLGADTLVSGGVVQSNTQTQVTAAAAALGLECHLVVFHGSIPAPIPGYESSGNAKLNRLFGAHLHDVYWDGDRTRACEALCSTLRNQGKSPFLVPYGASNALGAVAYASTIAEIKQQSNALGMQPASIVHCSGSGATQAGLIVGAATAMPETDIVGIGMCARPERVRTATIRHVEGLSELLDVEIGGAGVEVIPWRAKPHYGLPHQETTNAIALASALEGLIMDPVYSGKAFAGFISLVNSGRWKKDEDVVFVHTGGVLSSEGNGLQDVDAAA